jgi:5-formyltetrahydrofolate cyclo-ligase
MKKEEARKTYKTKRNELSAPERARGDDLMLIQFQSIPLPDVHHLLSYWPIEENAEPNTHLFNDYLEFRNPAIKFLYPRSRFADHGIEAIEVDADTAFQKNPWNIHEPIDGVVIDAGVLDMVFVPLLIFDSRGYRVGYGKGFYDRYLQQCRPDCLKVGFCYFEPIDELEGTHEFDVPLSLCITPNSIYVF